MDPVIALMKTGDALLPDSLWVEADYKPHADTSLALMSWDFVALVCAGVHGHISAHNHDLASAAAAVAAAKVMVSSQVSRERAACRIRVGLSAGLTKKNAAELIAVTVAKALAKERWAGAKAQYTCTHGVKADGYFTMELLVTEAV